jgi:hypothetical protein
MTFQVQADRPRAVRRHRCRAPATPPGHCSPENTIQHHLKPIFTKTATRNRRSLLARPPAPDAAIASAGITRRSVLNPSARARSPNPQVIGDQELGDRSWRPGGQ